VCVDSACPAASPPSSADQKFHLATSGGQLVSRIHAYTENGDPFARSFTDSVLEEVSKPFFYSLAQWIYHGDLHDPFAEFFVLPNPSLVHTSYLAASSTLLGAEDLGFGGGREGEGEGRGEGGVKSWELWRRKWEFKDEMRPSFVSEEFARKVSLHSTLGRRRPLLTRRRSIRSFQRANRSTLSATRVKTATGSQPGLSSRTPAKVSADHHLHSPVTASLTSAPSLPPVLQYSDIAGLERSIDAAYEIASKRLLEIFFDKFEFMDHLRALKMYLLLGHGDFVDSLMGSLACVMSSAALATDWRLTARYASAPSSRPDLSKPANQLYRHTLTATLEASIRSSNAAYDPPAVRRRLDARMLPYAHGESGWDCFVLDYKVDAPVDTVLDPRTMEAYQRMFVHLWKLKRVESALSGSWMRLVGGGNSRGSSRASA
jgi:gamma-tubulin complex component 3